MWVNRPIDTMHTNEAKGLHSLNDIDNHLKGYNHSVAKSHPGVQLVTGAAVA